VCDSRAVGRTGGDGGEAALRRFLACRAAGDVERARRAWAELVTVNLDRVRGMVALWGRGGRLSADEQQDAVQLAMVRLWRNMVGTFAGTSMGEWVNAARTCTGFACLDVQRAGAARSARESALDEVDEEGESTADRRLAGTAHAEHAREGERAEARDFIAWALPQVTDERRRLVLERTLDGVPAQAIAAEVGVEMGNLYQLRSRGLKDLARLREQWDG
jgi:RNA polymerase sigma factor (sigma-70 family)